MAYNTKENKARWEGAREGRQKILDFIQIEIAALDSKAEDEKLSLADRILYDLLSTKFTELRKKIKFEMEE